MKIKNHHISLGLFAFQILSVFIHFFFMIYWSLLSLVGILLAIRGLKKTKIGEHGYAGNVIGLILNGISFVIGFWFASKDWGLALHP